MQRRTVLQLLLSVLAWGPFGRKASARALFSETDAARLTALADAVLPQEIGAEGIARAVDQFLRWLNGYRAGAQLDHGYGFTRLQKAPPSPASKYSGQLDDLERRAGVRFASATRTDRQRAVAEAVTDAKVTELPDRPDGGHIATDLMAHYFRSNQANDLAYRHLIGRFGCRSLPESVQRPPELPGAAGTSP